MRAFFTASLAVILIGVANAQGSARAEKMANTIDAAQLAPEPNELSLPLTTPDGRVIPRSRRAQLENVLQKLHNRGALPPCAEVSFATLKLIAGEIAALDQGQGCFASLEYLARATNRSPTQIRLVCRFLEQQGFGFNFARVEADDRKIGGASRPVTGMKTTIRRVFPLTSGLLEKLTDEELLDLMAFGERKPMAQLNAPSTTSPAPAPAHVDSRIIPAELPPDAGILDGPLRELAEVSHVIAPTWILDSAREAGLEDMAHLAGALRELTEHLRTERTAALDAGKRWRPPSRERLEARIEKYLAGKLKWLERGGEQARLAEAAKAREEAHRAANKTPEQLARERGEVAPSEPPSAHHVPTLAKLDALARWAVDLERDPAKKTALRSELDEARRRLTAETDPLRRASLERALLDALHRAQAPPR